MRYRDLMELYEKKALSEQVMEEVSRDIEKQDAISEYLFEKDHLFEEQDEKESAAEEAEGTETEHESISGKAAVGGTGESRKSGRKPIRQMRGNRQDSAKFARDVNRLIRRAFLKMGVLVGAVVLALVLFMKIGRASSAR